MNQPPAEAITTKTFVVRFWREWSGAEFRWRGRVEHVQSGQAVAFMNLKQLEVFIKKFIGMTSGQEEIGRHID